MKTSKKTTHVLLLFFLLSFLSSCGDRCIDEDAFYDQQFMVFANPEDSKYEKIPIYGEYNHEDGGQTREWQDTGLLSTGDGFRIWVSGEAIVTNGEYAGDDLSSFPGCKLCFKSKDSDTMASDNCYCGPYIDKGVYNSIEKSQIEKNDQNDQTNTGLAPNYCDTPANQVDINKCTCKAYDGPEYFHSNFFVSVDKSIYKKTFIKNGSDITTNLKRPDEQKPCKVSMGYGLYISLWGVDGYDVPNKAYHLFTTSKTSTDGKKFCPSRIVKSNTCDDEDGNSRWVFVYDSPNNQIFKKDDTNYHTANEKIKITFYDQFYSDNKGGYKIQFIKGAFQQKDSGLLAGIVTEMEDFLFGSSYFDQKIKKTIKKSGIVEFMYKAVLKDQYVGRIINIGFVLYIAFFGMAFLMGVVELSKKELMMRLLKIGLVMMFTSPTAWQMYNTYVVLFFKNGMDSIISMIIDSYSSIIESSYREKGIISVGGFKAGTNFLYIDGLIKDLLSDPATKKIFSLLNMGNGKGFFAIIYIPVIYFLIFYFIYAMLDVALKYIINLLKICIGLALGPVFIFFSLFEKTKDMFKNWLAFMGSRSLEIIILFALLHPFITIMDVLFKDMLRFGVCPIGLDDNYKAIIGYDTFLRPQGSKIINRSIFEWFESFLKIGAMIFVTKSLAEKSAYISGQLISIGGISNADSVTEEGKGQGGFNIGSEISKGALMIAKDAITSKYIGGVIKKGLRVGAGGASRAMRKKVLGDRSVNDVVNDTFKAVGIRNRGPRSFMRDRKIDTFIGEAKILAENQGFSSPKDKDQFIRDTVIQKANQFINSNKNRATLLGVDHENILKRMDQKLVKEPLKSFIKAEAQRQKIAGKIGIDAEREIILEAKKWAKNNFVNEERTVSEFFKKKTIKSHLKNQALMSASNAFEYAKSLKQNGDETKYNEFIEKFRDATNQNAMRKRIKESNNEAQSSFPGKVQNNVNKLYAAIKNINPFSESAHKSNPKKTLRKFDRKLKRLNDKLENDKKFLDKSKSQFVNEQFEFLKINKNDSALVKIGKFIPNLVSRPITKIAKAYKNKNQTEDIKKDHAGNQFESYRRLAKDFDVDQKSYRQSRQEVEQIVLKIDRLSQKNPESAGATIIESLNTNDRILFQKLVNDKIDKMGENIIENRKNIDKEQKNKDKQISTINKKIEKLSKQKDASGEISPENIAKIEEFKKEIKEISDKFTNETNDKIEKIVNNKKEIEDLKNKIFKNIDEMKLDSERTKFSFEGHEFNIKKHASAQDSVEQNNDIEDKNKKDEKLEKKKINEFANDFVKASFDSKKYIEETYKI